MERKVTEQLPTPHKVEWIKARTTANLYVDGRYTGIQVSLRRCTPEPEILKILGLPALPKREG
jgi:hypothetical protein